MQCRGMSVSGICRYLSLLLSRNIRFECMDCAGSLCYMMCRAVISCVTSWGPALVCAEQITKMSMRYMQHCVKVGDTKMDSNDISLK